MQFARSVINRQDRRLAQQQAAQSGRYRDVSAEIGDVFHPAVTSAL